ncbi:MAG: NAD(P)/FAD-dependent oxidoreductase [Actinomycetota bacterium]|nr:NAD(P)/FAD-dependent oxidoreductase [Actinomycetota bacterium]
MTERVAIVGSGLGGFVAYATLRHRGLEPAEIAVFGEEDDPAGAWRPRAAAIRQRLMRSESDGHCHPTSFPGLAAREAARRRDLAPLVLSVCDRYRPTVSDFLRHVDELRVRSRWDESLRRARIERVQAVDGGFELDGRGVFRHVLLAPGHPGLSVPAELEADPRVVHAYQPHEYASKIAIVGAGMAAATEWLNALDAGAEVVSVRRREPARRPLNVPRPLFTKRGLAAFHASPPFERAALLRGFAEPSYPPGRDWDAPLERAAREARFRVEPELNGAAQVICATGFRRGFEHDPLLARLVAEHGLQTEDRWIVLSDDSTVPALTDRTRTLALAGVPGQWALPAADTLVGMKIAARRFRRRVESCPTR